MRAPKSRQRICASYCWGFFFIFCFCGARHTRLTTGTRTSHNWNWLQFMGREMAINWIYHNSIGKLAINLMKCAVNVTQIKPRHHSKRGGWQREAREECTHTHKVLVECCLRLSRHHRIIKHLSEMLALNKHPCDELRAAPAAAPVVLFSLLFAITSEWVRSAEDSRGGAFIIIYSDLAGCANKLALLCLL